VVCAGVYPTAAKEKMDILLAMCCSSCLFWWGIALLLPEKELELLLHRQ
jgi:hypothetical protein